MFRDQCSTQPQIFWKTRPVLNSASGKQLHTSHIDMASLYSLGAGVAAVLVAGAGVTAVLNLFVLVLVLHDSQGQM